MFVAALLRSSRDQRADRRQRRARTASGPVCWLPVWTATPWTSRTGSSRRLAYAAIASPIGMPNLLVAAPLEISACVPALNFRD